MSSTTGKALRFAALVRVSTEKQAKKGESLRTQTEQIETAVASLGGTIVRRYTGQEHATAGYEREKLNRLLADAADPSRPFDAVMVADPSRWSRDNVASETGLEVLKDAGIGFYILTTAYDLFDPQNRLFLGISATIGAFQARTQSQKSILNRIKRAQGGVPAAGHLPFGRTWDAKAQQWVVDPEKQAVVVEVAARYLAGESLPKLAAEFGLHHTHIYRVLRDRCGDTWTTHFNVPKLNIRQTVTHNVPRLLPEETIRAVRQRFASNRTHLHTPPRRVHDYLLAGRVFCSGCGYLMTGQSSPNGRKSYRHCRGKHVRACPYTSPRPWVRANGPCGLDSVVFADLFDLFGNPAAVERAVNAAAPNVEKERKRKQQIDAEVTRIKRARDRIIDQIYKDTITEAQVELMLRGLKDRETALRTELGRLESVLAAAPDPEAVRVYVEQIGDAILVYDDSGEIANGGNELGTYLSMTGQDRRALVDKMFNDPLPDDKPAGVYLTPVGGTKTGPKQFKYEIRGRLLPRVMPRLLPWLR